MRDALRVIEGGGAQISEILVRRGEVGIRNLEALEVVICLLVGFAAGAATMFWSLVTGG